MEKQRESANCPYCLSPIEDGDETVRCPVCGVVHHAECWKLNGKCSVYGCDGWQAWSGDIGDRIAPRVADGIDIAEFEPSRPAEQSQPLCMECGTPVSEGQLVCWRCRKVNRPRFLDNCAGPSVLVLIVLGTIATLMVRGLF